MSQRHAVTKAVATRYKRAEGGERAGFSMSCATTGWHRNHARKALKEALTPRLVRPRAPRPPRYGPEVVAALGFCWAVLGAPTGKRLAPVMAELVARSRRFEELVIPDATAGLLVTMSAATEPTTATAPLLLASVPSSRARRPVADRLLNDAVVAASVGRRVRSDRATGRQR